MHFSGSNLTSKSLKLVDQCLRDLFPRTQEESIWKTSLFGLDILSRSRDIRNQIGRCKKSTEILHVFGPYIFFRRGPPSCRTFVCDCRQIVIMWQSFAAIGRGTSEIWLAKEKKTSAVKQKPVRNSSFRAA